MSTTAKMSMEYWGTRRKKCPFYSKSAGRSPICKGHGLDYSRKNLCTYDRCPFVFWSEKEVDIR